MTARTTIISCIAGFIVAISLTGCAQGSSGVQPYGSTVSSGDGQTLVQTKCKMCHSLDRVDQARKNADEWDQTVTRMQSKGLVLTEEEKAAIIDYLSSK